MQSASDTLSEVLILSNWCKHRARHLDGREKWTDKSRLLAEVPSTSIEYCEVHKIPRVEFLWVPRSTVLPTQ